MKVKIEASWQQVLNSEFSEPYFESLTDFVREEYRNHVCYPPGSQIFAAFDYTPFNHVKVIMIGQDPYHGQGQAHGLCFSVNDGVKPPPSLNNIFKELKNDVGKDMPATGNLTHWAKQGVLLLNSILTVRANTPASHQNKGWERFTDVVIQHLNDKRDNLVFVLWGAFAQKKLAFIDENKHLVIESAHPSPFSAERGFFGSKPFSRANAFLISKGIEPIHW